MSSLTTKSHPHHPPGSSPAPHLIVMAKPPVPGRVNTRLTPTLTPLQAAQIHAASLQCLLNRLHTFITQHPSPKPKLHLCLASLNNHHHADFITTNPANENTYILSAAPISPHPSLRINLPPITHIIPQSAGNLGDRLNNAALTLPQHHPLIFLGADSPDLPLTEISRTLTTLQSPAPPHFAIGPAQDGGYWTLIARNHFPQLIQNIDWGTPNVYHQTIAAARAADLQYISLQPWHDLDKPRDLIQITRRLNNTSDPHLAALNQSINQITENYIMESQTDTSNSPADDALDFDLSTSRILIVDDNEQNVELLQAYLDALPCNVDTAFDGLEAIAYIDNPDNPLPDLILLDIMMPKMSGFEVCRKLKDDPVTRSIPIMMVTALNELGDIERGVESGTDDFVTKPVNKLELLTRVKSLLRVRHLKRELDRTEAYIKNLEQAKENDSE